MKKFAKDNRGFSLLEILIAMAIFVLCAAPFLRSLVLSIQTNAKSRELLNATTVAENVMEDIKSAGVDSYLGLDSSGGGISPSGSNAYGNIYKTGYDHYLLDDKNYKVEITLTASAKQGKDSSTAYNSTQLAELYQMSTLTDAFYVQSETESQELVTAYVNNPSSPVSDYKQAPSNILAGLVTDYEFDITYSSSIYEVNQKVTYLTASGNEVAEKNATIYSSRNGGGVLQRVYLFFSPSAVNHIVIDNTDDVPLELYLVRQTDTSGTVDLKVKESTVSLPAYTKIRTNIAESDPNLVWSSFIYNTTSLSYTGMKDRFGMNELDKTTDQADTRIYDIEVVVSDMDGTKITSLTGTALQ